MINLIMSDIHSYKEYEGEQVGEEFMRVKYVLVYIYIYIYIYIHTHTLELGSLAIYVSYRFQFFFLDTAVFNLVFLLSKEAICFLV